MNDKESKPSSLLCSSNFRNNSQVQEKVTENNDFVMIVRFFSDPANFLLPVIPIIFHFCVPFNNQTIPIRTLYFERFEPDRLDRTSGRDKTNLSSLDTTGCLRADCRFHIPYYSYIISNQL